MLFWLNKHSHWFITVVNAVTFQPNITFPENVTGRPLSESSHVLPSKTEGNVQLSEIKRQLNYKESRIIDRRKEILIYTCTIEKRKTLTYFVVSMTSQTLRHLFNRIPFSQHKCWTLCCYYLYTLETLISLCFSMFEEYK